MGNENYVMNLKMKKMKTIVMVPKTTILKMNGMRKIPKISTRYRS